MVVVNQRNVGDVPDKMVAKDCAKKEVALPMVVGLAVTNNNEKPLEIGKKSLIRSMVVKGSISSSMKPPHARKDKPQNGKVGQASTSTNKKYSSKRGRQITVNGNIESRIHGNFPYCRNLTESFLFSYVWGWGLMICLGDRFIGK